MRTDQANFFSPKHIRTSGTELNLGELESCFQNFFISVISSLVNWIVFIKTIEKVCWYFLLDFSQVRIIIL